MSAVASIRAERAVHSAVGSQCIAKLGNDSVLLNASPASPVS